MQQLKHETTIKRLRAAAKESEAAMARVQEKLVEAQQTIVQQAEELKTAERVKGVFDSCRPVPVACENAWGRQSRPLRKRMLTCGCVSLGGGGRCTPAYGAARAHSTAEAHLKRIAELEALVEELRGKEALSQANLQRAWAELSEQRKAVAELVGAAQSEALEREVRRLVTTPAGASESGAGEGQGGTVEGATGQRDGSAALGARWKRSWILTRAVQAR